MKKKLHIRIYHESDESEVISLWKRCGLVKPWNNPHQDIQRKLKVNPELFLVGESDGQLIATVMGGYEGHRGWINYLAVDPDLQRQGLAKEMMDAVEIPLRQMGCPKINLQIRETNLGVIQFYEAIGYKHDPVVSMAKRLVLDEPHDGGTEKPPV